MLAFLNPNGLYVIEQKFETFKHVLKAGTKKTDVTWQSVIKALDF